MTGHRTRTSSRTDTPRNPRDVHRRVAALAVVSVALVVACTNAPLPGSPSGQSAPTQPAATDNEPEVVALSVVLDDDGCRVTGSTTFDPGPVRIEADNQDGTDRASFQLLRIAPDGSFDTFDQHLAEEQARIDAGQEPLGFAGLATEVSGTLIAAGGQDTLEATLDEGDYILVCADWADGAGTDGTGRLIGAGRLTVGAPPVASPTAAGELVPVARGYAMMADLPGEPGVALLGGATRAGPPDLSDMWTFAPDRGWREITPPTLPELDGFAPLTGNAFAFDTASGLAVFVDIKGNPWTYDHTTNRWAAKPSGAGPTALLGAAMVYDSQSDRLIVFGGLDLATFTENNETWAYDVDAGTWERMNPAQSPTPRNYAAMGYDADSDRVILFGGAPSSGVLGDTWAYDYDSDAWTEMSPTTSPPGRTYSGMVYDPRGDRMVLVGGSVDQETASLGDVWEYDLAANGWTDVSPSDGPGARAWHAIAHDDESGLIVVFGGGDSRAAYTAETWLFDPAARTWREVAS